LGAARGVFESASMDIESAPDTDSMLKELFFSSTSHTAETIKSDEEVTIP
jgi:hypothetical protein